jgi:oxygen-independent coproporphyrinogen-3 oxidase
MEKLLSDLIGNVNTLSVYIHIPFCKKKCYYCDFVSYEEGSVENYINALSKEIELYSDYLKRGIRTLYIGGGTPSYINEHYIEQLVKNLEKYLVFEEFTIEVNPDSFDRQKAQFYKEIGVSRLSIGIQSFDNEVLKKAGRSHDSAQALKAYNVAREYFENVNVDFIIGLPGESWSSIEEIVKFIRENHPPHISVYLLEIHEGTILSNFYKKIPEESYNRYEVLLDFLKSEGYERYEISNFALDKNYSKHNLVYWANLDYIGLGLSSGGHIGNLRYNNVSDFETYYSMLKHDKFPRSYENENTLEREVLESIFMMLRTKWGIDRKLLPILPGFEKVIELLKKKYDFFDGQKLNEMGMDFSSIFFTNLLEIWEDFYEI